MMKFAFGAGSVPCKQQHIISTEIELARPTTHAGTNGGGVEHLGCAALSRGHSFFSEMPVDRGLRNK
jgi:hypothetical protein